MSSTDEKLHRYLIKVWYIGTRFFGLQRQPNLRTVEGELIKTLQTLDYLSKDDTSSFKTAARTDAGVHAFDSAFCFSTLKNFYPTLVDSRLPDDMGLNSWVEVPLDFHPRWEAGDKTYNYVYPLPFSGNNLNMQKIKIAMAILQDTHDFRMFSKTDVTKPDKLTKLTLKQATVQESSNKLIFTFTSQSFLWEQIRRTISFLLQIGGNNATIQDLNDMLSPENHSDPTLHRNEPVNSEGLILKQIDFSKSLKFKTKFKIQKRRRRLLSQMLFSTQQTLGSLLILNIE